MSRSTLHRGGVAGLLPAWGLAVTIGILPRGAHAVSPGDAGAVSARWPGGGAVQLDGRRPTLPISVHPRCPCSRASLEEPAIILDRSGGRASAHEEAFRPRHEREDWRASPFAEAVAGIPGLMALPDRGGDEARRFGVTTSGHVLLFDTRGDLMFSGGITPGRGERGGGAGRAVLLGRIMGERGEGPGPPVFGCWLRTPQPARDPG